MLEGHSKRNEEEVYKMYDERSTTRKRLGQDICFDKGSMIGLNDKLLKSVCRIYRQTKD